MKANVQSRVAFKQQEKTTLVQVDQPKILAVDDEQDNLDYVRRALRNRYELHLAQSGKEGLNLLRKHDFALILSDIKMPEMSGLDFLNHSLTIAPNAVRVVLTAYADVDFAVSAINDCRVTAFIRKPTSPTEIQQTVEGALEVHRLRMQAVNLAKNLEQQNRQLQEKENLLQLSLDDKTKELLRANRALEDMVVRDSLTGLYNHRHFQERAEQELQRASRYNLKLSLIFLDIDYFKQYNDTHGHPLGDKALIKIARILQNDSRSPEALAKIRGTDFVARYGGEEFVVLLPQTPKDGARIVGERIRKAVERSSFPGMDQMPDCCLTISAGIACYPGDAADKKTLIQKADEALYRAKTKGRNCVVVWE